MYYCKNEDIPKRVETYTFTAGRGEDNTLRAYTHAFITTTTKILPNVSRLNSSSEEAKILAYEPILNYNDTEPLDVPMFHTQIVQVIPQDITIHAYIPKEITITSNYWTYRYSTYKS